MIDQISAPTPQRIVDIGSIYPTIPEPTQYQPTPLYPLQPQMAETSMTTLQSVQATWMYDQTLTGVYNRVTKPDVFNEKWTNTSKQEYWSKMQGLLGSNADEYKDEYDRMVFSPQDAQWFTRTSMNKQSAKAAWNSHTLAALASTVLDPTNALGAVGKVGKIPELFKAIDSLGTLGRATAYGAMGAVGGVAATAPNAAWNYDDASNVAVGAILGGSIFSLLGIAKGKDFQYFQKKMFQPAKIDDTTDIRTAVEKSDLPPEQKKKVNAQLNYWLSISDETQAIWPQFSKELMALGARGTAKSMRTATSEAGTLNAKIDAQNIAKLQQNLKKIPGYFAQGLWQHAKMGIFGRQSQGLIPAAKIQDYNRQAMGYMATKYNWQSTMDSVRIAQQQYQKVARAVDPQVLQSFVPLDTKSSIDGYQLRTHVKALAQRINQLNKKIPAFNARMVMQEAKIKTLDNIQQYKPIQFDATLMYVKNPSINKIDPIAQQIVKAYQDSGIAKALNDVLRSKGVYYTPSDNYTHLHIDHYRIDDMAKGHMKSVQQRAPNEVARLRADIKDLELAATDDVAKQAENIQKLQRLKQQLNIWKQVQKDPRAALMRAYDQVAYDYGEQLYSAIKALHPKRFQQTGAQAVGYLLMMRRLPPGAGHYEFHQAWNRCRKRMTKQGMRAIINDIIAYDDQLLQDITKHLGSQFKLQDYITAATNERRLNTSAIVGQSNLFKKRFREDLMRPGRFTGYRPLDYLNANLYKTAQSMVQQTTARASLMGRKLQIGNKVLNLGDPADLQRALNHLVDRARQSGYDSQQASELADAVMNTILGRPVGDKMNTTLQIFNALGTMSMLKNSGLYQLVEQFNLNVEYGHLNVARVLSRALSMGTTFKKLTENDDGTVKYMLAKMMAAEGRIRPSVERVGEDVQDIANSAFAQTVQYAAQYTKFLNGGEFVRLWQNNQAAIICQSTLFDALKKGKASGRLAQMFTQEQFKTFLQQYRKHGTKFKQWRKEAQDLIARGFTEQIGNVVLSMRRGERPRILMTNEGRWIFAFQTFVWGAHNKLLRRYMNDGNMLKLTHLILTQMTASVGAIYLSQMLKGNNPQDLDPYDMVGKMGTSVSAVGLLSPLISFLDRGQIGGSIPALGFLTNVFRGATGVAQGNFMDMYNTLPLASVFLPMRAVAAAVHSMDE